MRHPYLVLAAVLTVVVAAHFLQSARASLAMSEAMREASPELEFALRASAEPEQTTPIGQTADAR